MCFCCGFSKFHTEFHIDVLLHDNTLHDSNGEQEHDPLQAKATAKLFAAQPWNCNREWKESTSQYHTLLAVAKFTAKWKIIKSGYFIGTPRMTPCH